MLILSILIFLIFIVLLFASRKEEIDKKQCSSKLLLPVDRISSYLYKKIRKIQDMIKKKVKFKRAIDRKRSYQTLKKLYPEVDISFHHSKHCMDKISLFIGIVFFSNALIFFSEINTNTESILVNQLYLPRSSMGEGSKTILLNATIKEDNNQEFQVEVGEQRLSKEDTEKLLDDTIINLQTLILGENKSLDEIRKPLNLITNLRNSPLKIEWEISDYSLLGLDGQLGNRVPAEKGELVKLTATISYFDTTKETQFFVRRFPPLLTENEKLYNKITEKLLLEDKKSAATNFFKLPDKVGNQDIKWSEPKKEYSKIILLLMIVTIIMVSISKDKDLEKNLQRKNEELEKEYPEIISKLVLYMGAGMTSRGAFFKIADDYRVTKRKKGKEKYAYEEIVYICNKMSSGSSEKEAYECLGKRCKLAPYKKLITLLTQNLQKGSSVLLKSLKEESEKALEERKTQAKRKGEKAETQLLLPMMIMLGIVMIIIMFPAYMSFSIG